MSFQNIFLFCSRAISLAVPVTLFFCVLRFFLLRRRHEKLLFKKEISYVILCFYLTALIQITVIRGGVDFGELFTLNRSMETVQLIPIVYTLCELKNGLWAFVYPVLGNIIWFVPLGILLPQISPRWKKWIPLCLTGFLLSLAIELCQWIFGSGISDIDDILLNTVGTLLPQVLFTLYHKLCKKNGKKHCRS